MRLLKKYKRLIVYIAVFMLMLGILGYLTYMFPISGYGQRHLQNKAEHTFEATYPDIEKNFVDMPKQKMDLNNAYCNELAMRFLELGESSWIQECSVIKLLYINVEHAANLPDALRKTEQILANKGWTLEGKKLPSQLEAIKQSDTYYIKRSDKTRCYLGFSYTDYVPDVPRTAGLTFIVHENCDYYYRSIFDL